MSVHAEAIFRLRRRAFGGAAGAPSALRSSELSYNEADDTIYIGYGDDGSGNATSIRAVAGAGTFATKTFVNDAVGNAGGGDMLKATYDSDNDGKVDAAEVADEVPWTGVKDAPATFPPSAHSHDIVVAAGAAGFMSGADKTKLDAIANGANNYVHPSSDGNRHVPATAAGDVIKFLKAGTAAGAAPAWSSVSKADVGLGNVSNLAPADYPVSTAQQSAVDAKANIASPTFTGSPKAPTAAPTTNTTQIATTAFVKAALEAMIGAAPAALDTLTEIAEALNNDPNFATTITTLVGEKLSKSANFSDVANVATARSNLGLGSLATQSADNVNISGGTISNLEIIGGTF